MESKTDYAACLKTVTDFSVAYIKLISRGVFFFTCVRICEPRLFKGYILIKSETSDVKVSNISYLNYALDVYFCRLVYDILIAHLLGRTVTQFSVR